MEPRPATSLLKEGILCLEVWLLLILMVFSPDVCEVWEGVVTFLLLEPELEIF